ncbi:hypothetical protein CDAR_550491 [Caerostris darwini]|uniref:Uncharacterized protein n=1 Tax=Caerostris darwini TaxID=1538125 RepID=A0AAV4XB53_9ARAC|nr:hypothetical protein CDAR_550491 [Caerostris darwini]
MLFRVLPAIGSLKLIQRTITLSSSSSSSDIFMNGIDSTIAITVPQTDALPCSTSDWIIKVDTTNSYSVVVFSSSCIFINGIPSIPQIPSLSHRQMFFRVPPAIGSLKLIQRTVTLSSSSSSSCIFMNGIDSTIAVTVPQTNALPCSTSDWIVKVDTTNSYSVAVFFFFLHLHQWDTIDSTNPITVPQTNALLCSTIGSLKYNEQLFCRRLPHLPETSSLG